jgi:hypothetical protein
MDTYEIVKLKLLKRCQAPFFQADLKEWCQAPFSPEECIFFFTLDELTGAAIDPDPAGYICDPVSCEEIPAGDYFFAQQREALDRESCISMAIEVQREILWQRLQPQPGLYLRRLYEDGSPVTQIFRPYR